jgi:hypothetical protein
MAGEEFGAKGLIKTAAVLGAVGGLALYLAPDKKDYDLEDAKKPKKAKRRIASMGKPKNALVKNSTSDVTKKSGSSTRVARGRTSSSATQRSRSIARNNSGGGGGYSYSNSTTSLYSSPESAYDPISTGPIYSPSYFEPTVNQADAPAAQPAPAPVGTNCFGASCGAAGVVPPQAAIITSTTTAADDPIVTSNSIANITQVYVDPDETPDGTYFPGDANIMFDIVFSENVEVLGSPRLILETGDRDAQATYVAGSGSSVLTFAYEILNGDVNSDLDYEGTDALVLAGGLINTQSSGLAADLTLPLPGSSGSVSFDRDLDIQDNVQPVIVRIDSPDPNGRYGNGDIVRVVVTFDEVVTVSAGPPWPQISVDSTAPDIDYTSGSGTASLVFEYTVIGGENSLDLDVTAVNFNTATIQDASLNNADLTLPVATGRLNNLKDIIIDSTAPTITQVTSPTADGIYGVGSIIPIEVIFDERINKVGTPTLTLNTDPAPTVLNYFGGNGTTKLIFNYVVAENDTTVFPGPAFNLDATAITAGGGVTDVVSNPAVLTLPIAPSNLGTFKNITIDGIIPTITGITAPQNKTYYHDEALDFIVNFSENVDVTGTPQLKLDVGGSFVTADYLVGTGTSALTFRYIPKSPDYDNDGIAFNGFDLDFNGGSIEDVAKNQTYTDFSGVAPVVTGILIDNWKPTNISNLLVWLDPSDYATVFNGADCSTGPQQFPGANIGCIMDKSGNNNHFIQTDVLKVPNHNYNATNGLSLDFDRGALDFLETTGPLGLNNNTGERTVYAVAKTKDTLTRNTFFALGQSGTPSNFLSLENNTFNTVGGFYGIYSNGNAFDVNQPTSTNIAVFGFSALTIQGTLTSELLYQVNGNTATYNNVFGADDWGPGATFATYNSASVGTLPGSSVYADAYLYELVVFDKALHPTELWFLNCYMAKKYNFEATLPAGYCATAPTPTITKVRAVNPDGFYDSGTIDIEVVFTEPVDVAGGTPFLVMETDGITTSQPANYDSGSGSNVLTFKYDIQPGDENVDLTYVNPLTSFDNNGATVKSSTSGLNALLTLPSVPPFSLAALSNISVDTNNPIDGGPANPTGSAYNNTGNDLVLSWVGFTDETLTDHRIELFLADATCTAAPAYTFLTGSAANNDNGVIDGIADGQYYFKVTAIDGLAKETSSACSVGATIVDTIAPTIVNIDANPATDAYYRLGQSVDIQVTFSETVQVDDFPDIMLDSGATVAYSSGAPGTTLTFSYTVGAGQNSVDLDVIGTDVSGIKRIYDLADNDADLTLPVFGGVDDQLLENRDIVIDTVAPYVAYVNRNPGADGVFRIGDTITIEVVFSEPVSVAGSPVIGMNNGGPNVAMTSNLGNTLTFDYTVASPEMALDLDVTTMTAGAGIEDLAGNTASVAMPAIGPPDDRLSEVRDLRVDTLSPYVQLVTSSLPNATYKTGEYIPIEVEYDQDLKVTGGVPFIKMDTTNPAVEKVDFYKFKPQGKFFTANTIPSVNTATNSLGNADINNDGYMDLAISDFTGNNIRFYTGNNAGVFTLSFTQAATSPREISFGDFDHDGNVDYVVGSSAGLQPFYAFGRGDGTFGNPVSFGAAVVHNSFVIEDFNNDGHLDFIAGMSGAGGFDVYLGGGDGNFTGPINFASSGRVTALKAGDFDNDDDLDIAVAFSNSGNISVHLGNGDGTFAGAINLATGDTISQTVAVGDFDNNGNLDVVGYEYNNGNSSVFFGNGSGGFGAEVQLTTDANGGSIFAKDMNGDGFADVTTLALTGCQAFVHLSDGVGGFDAGTAYPIGGTDCARAVMADYNSDNLYDLVIGSTSTVNFYFLQGASNTLIYANKVLLGHSSADYTYENAYAQLVNGATIASDTAVNADPLLPVPGVTNSLDDLKDLIIDGSDNLQIQKILPPPPNYNNDFFGGADIHIQDDKAIIASASHDRKQTDGGVVYFYKYDGYNWIFVEKLENPDGIASGDNFGSAVAIDGDRMVIAASGDEAIDEGALYYYEYNGARWGYQQKLTSSNVSALGEMGFSVSLNGNFLAAGAPIHNPGAAAGAGGIQVFKFNGVQWEEDQFLEATDNDAGDNLGFRVSVWGNYIAATAPTDDGAGANRGALYIFEYNGTTWSQKHKFTPGTSTLLGYGLAMSGERLVVGSHNDGGKGAAHFYTFNGTNWVFVQTVQSAVGSASQEFGYSVGLYGDMAMIGAPNDDNAAGTGAGALYVFQDDGASWAERDMIIPRDNENNKRLGEQVHSYAASAISGASGDASLVPGGGAAYVTNYDITSVTGTSPVSFNGTFFIGQTITFDLVFSDDITVVGGPLQLMLNNGGIASCVYEPTNKLRCSYTVALGEYVDDMDFLSFDSLLYNGATITDSAGKKVTLNLPAPGSSSSLGNNTNYYLPSPPPEPVNLVGYSIDDTKVQLQWGSGGANTEGYHIAWQLGGAPPADCSTPAISNFNGTSFVANGLLPNTQYSFRVCSVNLTYVSTGITTTVTTEPAVKMALVSGWNDPQLSFNVNKVLPLVNGKFYVAGDFNARLAALSPRTTLINNAGAKITSFKHGIGFNSTVYAIEKDPEDNNKYYFGGAFTDYNGTAINYLGKVALNGTLDLGFDTRTGANGNIYAIQPLNDGSGKVYIGGAFTTYGGQPRAGLARVNANGSVDMSFNPGAGFTGGEVRALALAPDGTGDIYVGGTFTQFQGTNQGGIIRLNSSATEVDSFDVGVTDQGFTGGGVYSILVPNDGTNELYIGGTFTSYKGSAEGHIVRLQDNGSKAVGFTTGVGFNGAVYKIQADSSLISRIYVGGDFTTYPGGTPQRLVRLNDSGTIDGSFSTSPGFDGAVRDIEITTDGVYAVGDFNDYDSNPINFIVRLDPSDGSYDGVFNSGQGLSSSGYAIVGGKDPTHVLTGGMFTAYGGLPVGGIARFNSDGTIDSTFNAGLGVTAGSITDIELAPDDPNDIYVAGTFNTFNGTPASKIVRINSNGTIDSDTTFNTVINNGFNGNVLDIESANDGVHIYVGGDFTQWNLATHNKLVKLDNTGGIQAGWSIGTGFDNSVNKIRYPDDGSGDVLVGGAFTNFNTVGTNRIVRLDSDGSRDTAFDGNLGAGFDGEVTAIEFVGDTTGAYYVGGDFANYGTPSVSAPRIVKLAANGSKDVGFNPGTGLDAVPNVISLNTDGSNDIYVGGQFTQYDGDNTTRLVRITNNGSIKPSFYVGLRGYSQNVKTVEMAKDGSDEVFIGGEFTDYNFEVIQFFGRYEYLP